MKHSHTRTHGDPSRDSPTSLSTGSAGVCTQAWRTRVLQRLGAPAGQSTEHSTAPLKWSRSYPCWPARRGSPYHKGPIFRAPSVFNGLTAGGPTQKKTFLWLDFTFVSTTSLSGLQDKTSWQEESMLETCEGKKEKDILLITVILIAYLPLLDLLETNFTQKLCRLAPRGEGIMHLAAECVVGRLLTTEHLWVSHRARGITQGNGRSSQFSVPLLVQNTCPATRLA